MAGRQAGQGAEGTGPTRGRGGPAAGRGARSRRRSAGCSGRPRHCCCQRCPARRGRTPCPPRPPLGKQGGRGRALRVPAGLLAESGQVSASGGEQRLQGVQGRRAAGLGLSPGAHGLGGQVSRALLPSLPPARQVFGQSGDTLSPGTRCPLPSPPLPQAASWPAPRPRGAAGGLCPPCSESSVETAEPVLSVRTRSRLCTDSCSRRRFRKWCSRCSCSLMPSALRSCSSSFWRRAAVSRGPPPCWDPARGTEARAGSPSPTGLGPGPQW